MKQNVKTKEIWFKEDTKKKHISQGGKTGETSKQKAAMQGSLNFQILLKPSKQKK